MQMAAPINSEEPNGKGGRGAGEGARSGARPHARMDAPRNDRVDVPETDPACQLPRCSTEELLPALLKWPTS